MNEAPEPTSLAQIAAETRYPVDGYHFVRRGLDFTVHRIHSDPEQLPEAKRHVSGRQLSEGLRDYAIDQYGYLARTVLSRWRICRTEDFGSIVFAMVEAGLMQATDADTEADFQGVFSFEEAFVAPIPVNRVPTGGFEPDPVEQGEAP